jgi:hypothetical protein
VSFDVELLVTFACSQLDGVAEIARRQLPLTQARARELECPEAIAFLEHYAGRSGVADLGPKNGLTAWTYGGNYTDPDKFVECLQPVWNDLLRSDPDGGPSFDCHILVIYQLQDIEHAGAREIYLDVPESARYEEAIRSPLVVKRHDPLPFRFF